MLCSGCCVEVVGAEVCPGCGVRSGEEPRPAQTELPSVPWELSAPESFALRWLNIDCNRRSDAATALKLAVTELVARQALRLDAALVKRRWAPGERQLWMLSDGEKVAGVFDHALEPAVEEYERLRSKRRTTGIAYLRDEPVELDGVLVTDLVRDAGRHDFRGNRHHETAQLLGRRGYASAEGRRTPEGDAAERRLDGWLDAGRAFPARATEPDPSWARAYLSGAGAAVLLSADVLSGLAGHSRLLEDGTDGVFDLVALRHDLATVGGLKGAVGVIDSCFARATSPVTFGPAY